MFFDLEAWQLTVCHKTSLKTSLRSLTVSHKKGQHSTKNQLRIDYFDDWEGHHWAFCKLPLLLVISRWCCSSDKKNNFWGCPRWQPSLQSFMLSKVFRLQQNFHSEPFSPPVLHLLWSKSFYFLMQWRKGSTAAEKLQSFFPALLNTFQDEDLRKWNF